MAADSEVPFSLLLASSVHDIKNSVGLLMQTLAVVIAESDSRDLVQRQRFATMQGEAARINNDLMYLLGLYRLQNRQLPIRIEQVFMHELLSDQIAQQHLLFEARGIAFELDCDPDLIGYCDPALVAGIINNVLVNALRYSRQRITLAAWDDSGGVAIAVADDGDGFPATMLTPDQEESTPAPIDFTSGSTSLGLYFAREVARLHRRGSARGRIELTNQPDGGGRFVLRLP